MNDVVRVLDNDGQVRSIDEIEAEVIRFALAHYGRKYGGMSRAARQLGIGRSTLYRHIKEEAGPMRVMVRGDCGICGASDVLLREADDGYVNACAVCFGLPADAFDEEDDGSVGSATVQVCGASP